MWETAFRHCRILALGYIAITCHTTPTSGILPPAPSPTHSPSTSGLGGVVQPVWHGYTWGNLAWHDLEAYQGCHRIASPYRGCSPQILLGMTGLLMTGLWWDLPWAGGGEDGWVGVLPEFFSIFKINIL